MVLFPESWMEDKESARAAATIGLSYISALLYDSYHEGFIDDIDTVNEHLMFLMTLFNVENPEQYKIN